MHLNWVFTKPLETNKRVTHEKSRKLFIYQQSRCHKAVIIKCFSEKLVGETERNAEWRPKDWRPEGISTLWRRKPSNFDFCQARLRQLRRVQWSHCTQIRSGTSENTNQVAGRGARHHSLCGCWGKGTQRSQYTNKTRKYLWKSCFVICIGHAESHESIRN